MRVLIADDHPVVRQGIKEILTTDACVTVVAEAASADETLRAARNVEWDVAVVDFTMPGRSGLELVDDMKREFPTRPVLVLTMHGEDIHGSSVLRRGANGYLTKECAAQELPNALRKVAGGGRYVSAALADILVSEYGPEGRKAPHEKLSDREHRVMWLLATGKHIKEIAHELGISASTVGTYRSRVLRKLGVPGNAGLVQYAIRHQLV